MHDWHNVYITDKSGEKFFNTHASPLATASEIKNISRHLEAIKAGHPSYAKCGIDRETATLMLNGSPYISPDDTLSDDDLLAELEN